MRFVFIWRIKPSSVILHNDLGDRIQTLRPNWDMKRIGVWIHAVLYGIFHYGLQGQGGQTKMDERVIIIHKKSGSIIVYESTSHYDPVTKQSRPIRKYLGIEDPITGELIPSSGKRGRKKSSEGTVSRKQKKPPLSRKKQRNMKRPILP